MNRPKDCVKVKSGIGTRVSVPRRRKVEGISKVEGEEIDGLKKVGYDLFNLEDDSFLKYLKFSLEHGSWSKDA
jgi:hypothetical protein